MARIVYVYGKETASNQQCLISDTSVSAENTRGGHTYSRIVILTAHVTAVVILTSYSASLIACIVHEKYNLPFTNFQEFINDGTYELEVLANSAELDYFKVNEQLFQNIDLELIVALFDFNDS